MSSMEQPNRTTLTFEVERETKGAVRFQEVTDDTTEPAVGTLYVRKTAFAKLGKPDTLTVTIEPAS